MVRFGAHLSIAGGLERSLEQAQTLGCTALQIFLRPPGRWAPRPVPPEEAARFCRKLKQLGLASAAFAHAPYLLNLASPEVTLARQSWQALRADLLLAGRLGLRALVVHPGSAKGTNRARAGARVREGLGRLALSLAPGPLLLLENTAGSGDQLGANLQELAALLPQLPQQGSPFGLCLDTAHLWAAGYDLPHQGWARVEDELAALADPPPVILVHLNDTPVPCGSRKDRHCSPGQGLLGEKFFQKTLAWARKRQVPLVMEIPPGKNLQGVRAALNQLRFWLEAH